MKFRESHTEQLLPMEATYLDAVSQLMCYCPIVGCSSPGIMGYWLRAGDTSTGFLSHADLPRGYVQEFPDDRNIQKK